jgi:glutamate 5-kinase
MVGYSGISRRIKTIRRLKRVKMIKVKDLKAAVGQKIHIEFHDHAFTSHDEKGTAMMQLEGRLSFVGEKYAHVQTMRSLKNLDADGYSILLTDVIDFKVIK